MTTRQRLAQLTPPAGVADGDVVTYDSGGGIFDAEAPTGGGGGGGGDPITWTKLLNVDPMSAGTNWINRSGTWTPGGAFGTEESSAGGDDWYEADIDFTGYDLRAIEVTVRPTSGEKVGVGFHQPGGWGGGGLAIALDTNADDLWYDRYGSGGANVNYALDYATDYVLKVVEVASSAKWRVYVDGVLEWTVDRPFDVNVGAVGLYGRSGAGWFRDVTIWGGVLAFNMPT